MAALNGSPFVWPIPLGLFGNNSSSGFSDSSVTFDNASDVLGCIGQIPKTGTLTNIHFITGTVTTGCTIGVRIETLSNGRPSGVLYDANGTGTVVVANTDDSTVKTVSINGGTGITVTEGDQVAIVFNVSSGTPNGVFFRSNWAGWIQSFPNTWFNNGGAGYAWNPLPNILGGIEYSTGYVWYDGFIPATVTRTTYNSGSTPDERALRFQIPFGATCAGALVAVGDIAAGADFTVLLENSGGTVLASSALDGDHANATTDTYRLVRFAKQTLSANTTYYLSVRPDTANNITLNHMTLFNANARAAIGGTETYLSTRTNGGAWSDTTTSVPVISLLFTELTDSSGGGIGARIVGGGF